MDGTAYDVVPVPEMFTTVCGRMGSLVLIVRAPVRIPVADGVKVRINGHTIPGAKCAKHPAFGLTLPEKSLPASETLLCVSEMFPVLCSIKGSCAVVPTGTAPKIRGIQLTRRCGHYEAS